MKLVYQKEQFSRERLGIVEMILILVEMILSPDHLLDGVAGQSVEEHGEEEGEEDDEDDLEDRPLVVVPDDVPDRLQRVEEPHEGRVRSPAKIFFIKSTSTRLSRY